MYKVWKQTNKNKTKNNNTSHNLQSSPFLVIWGQKLFSQPWIKSIKSIPLPQDKITILRCLWQKVLWKSSRFFTWNDLKYFWSSGPCKVRAECRKNAQESTTTWWCKQHKIDAEEETDLHQDTVHRTMKAPGMLYLFGFGGKKAFSCNWRSN